MRSAGILMPIFSLPSPYGIGTLGAAARDFVQFLSKAGQTFWQLLPIGPTSFGDSPYQSFSAYAGNPYFIDLDDLMREGLLKAEEYQALDWGNDAESVDYGLLYERRYPVLRLACVRLLENKPQDFDAFCLEQAAWLDDYALFMALKESHGGASWFQWPDAHRLREKAAMDDARRLLSEEISFWRAVQYLFFRQWSALKAFAADNGIRIIGDLPIYVSGDSVDVWANPEQFQLNENGVPTEVAGCPPDGFSADGQLWGNPLFNWPLMEKDGYCWWLRRIAFQFEIYDVLRIDHFRGFDSYYGIPYGDKTARNGAWHEGPGKAFFKVVNSTLGRREFIAEDLGFMTDSVLSLLEYTGYPGMKVLEFAFDSRDTAGSSYLPHKYPTGCVVYTGTHDNDTICGWMATAPEADVAYAKRYLRLNRREGYNWGMMRAAWASVAGLAIMQAQDLLGLGSGARINVPATVGTNWKWRARPGVFTPSLAKKLLRDMALYGRLPAAEQAKTERSGSDDCEKGD